MQLSLLLLFVFISLIIGFVAAHGCNPEKSTIRKRGYESTVNQVLEEENSGNQLCCNRKRLTLRTEENTEIQVNGQKLTTWLKNRG